MKIKAIDFLQLKVAEMILVCILSLTNFLIRKTKGQSLQVTPNPAIGILGGSVDITWTITKINQSDLVSNTRLFLGESFITSNLLYRGSVVLDKLEYAERKFGDRIQAIFIEPNYTLTLRNLSFSDLITFILVVNQEIGGTLTPRSVTFKSVEINEVRGGPEFCLGDFPSIFVFDDNSLPRINITLCGVPQPEVRAEFTSRILTVLSKPVNNYARTYTLELPRLTQTTCGRELIVTAIGHSGTLTKKIKFFVENFVPGKVEIDNFFRNDDQVGCNSTRRVQWQPINTGSCTVEYAIAFRNSANDTIGTIEHIRDSFYCTSGYDNANSVIIWAMYNGTKGPESEANFLTDTPKPVPPTTIILPTITQKGHSGETQGRKNNNGNLATIIVVVVLLVTLIVTIVAFIIIRRKRNKGGNSKSKKRADEKNYPGGNNNVRDVIPIEAPQYTEIGIPLKAISDPKFTSLHGMNQTDLDSQKSNYINQQPNYANQPSFHRTQSDNETNCYAALQDGDWTKNDYQPLQMIYQGARPRESMNQRSPVSQKDYQGTSNYVSMHATLLVKRSNLPCTNSEYDVPKSSHYGNQQVNYTSKPSNYINLA